MRALWRPRSALVRLLRPFLGPDEVVSNTDGSLLHPVLFDVLYPAADARWTAKSRPPALSDLGKISPMVPTHIARLAIIGGLALFLGGCATNETASITALPNNSLLTNNTSGNPAEVQ